MSIRTIIPALLTLTVLLPAAAGAQRDRVSEAIDTAEETTRRASRSQSRVDRLDDQTRRALEQYRRAVWETQQLTVYQQQLSELQKLQAIERAELRRALDDVPLKEEDLMPLMLRMVNTLERFIEADLPFALDERRERVAALKRTLGDGEASLTEQFRKVVEAYQAEVAYGRGLNSRRTQLDVDGSQQVVDTLRVGRVALFFLTLDGEQAAMWNPDTQRWDELPATERPAVRQGIRIARQNVAPELLTLPMPTPERLPADGGER